MYFVCRLFTMFLRDTLANRAAIAFRLSKLNPREFIGSFEGETIASSYADTDQRSDPSRR
jgi:hypothetical protein